jgi:Domain of unknown function (DUF4062)
MADFPAAELCADRVCGCDVYVGVLCTRYGSPVADKPEVSYTELEFDIATAAGLARLVFFLDTAAADVGIPLDQLIDHALGARQKKVPVLVTARIASYRSRSVSAGQSYLTSRPVTARPISMRWISLVPSKIVKLSGVGAAEQCKCCRSHVPPAPEAVGVDGRLPLLFSL